MEAPNGDLYVGTFSKGIFKSTNNGDTWSEVNDGIAFLNIQALTSNVQGHVFAGSSGGGIYRSVDDGKTWSQINNGLTNLYIAALAVNKEGAVFCITGFSRVFRSTDNGETWTRVFYGGDLGMNCLYVAPNGFLLSGCNKGVYGSTDGGNTWYSYSTDDGYVPAMAFDSLGYVYIADPLRVWYASINVLYWNYLGYQQSIYSLAATPDGTLYAGHLNDGVYMISNHDKESWQLVNDNLSDTHVHCLLLKSDGILYAGTLSGTVFRSTKSVTGIQSGRDQVPQSFELYQNYPNPFNPSTTITYSIPFESEVMLRVFNVLGEEVKSLVHKNTLPGIYSVTFNASGLSSGIYMYELSSETFKIRKKMMLLR